MTATTAHGNVSDNIRGVYNTTLANNALGRGSFSIYSMKPIIPDLSENRAKRISALLLTKLDKEVNESLAMIDVVIKMHPAWEGK